MNLIFLYGPPGVGKLTVARHLATLTRYRLFHNHLTVDLLLSVFPFGSPAFVTLREQIWMDVFQASASEKIPLIFTLVPERTVSEGFIGKVTKAIQKRGASVHFVELTCSPTTLEKRMVSDLRHTHGKLTSIQQYHSLQKSGAFDYPMPPPTLRLDTTNQLPDETAHQISKALSLPSNS